MSLPKVLKIGFVSIKGKDPYGGKEVLVPRPKDVRLAELIARALNVEYEMVLSTDLQHGSMLSNGTFTGAFGLVQRQEVDLVATDLAITTERQREAHFTFPIIIDSFTFLSRKPQFSPKFLTMFYPFSQNLWFYVLACLVSMCLVFCAVLWKRHEVHRVVLNTFGSLLSKSDVFEPNKLGEKMLVLSWSVGTMFLTYSYTAVLLSFLTLPTRERGVRTIPELAQAITDGRYNAATFKGIFLADVLANSDEESLRIIGNDVQNYMITLEEEKDVLFKWERRMAVLGSREYSAFLKNRCFMSEDNLFSILIALAYKKSFCCPERLNMAVHSIISAGLYRKILDDDTFRTFLEELSSEERSEAEQEVVLNLKDVSGAFIFLAIGYILSLSIFFLEVVTFKNCSAGQKNIVDI